MLPEIRYYFGEESKHGTGFGIAPGNLSIMREDISRKYKENKLTDDSYLIETCFVQLPETVPRENASNLFKEWGQLGIRIVGESDKSIKKCTKTLDLPFSKKEIFPTFKF